MLLAVVGAKLSEVCETTHSVHSPCLPNSLRLGGRASTSKTSCVGTCILSLDAHEKFAHAQLQLCGRYRHTISEQPVYRAPREVR